MFAMTFKETGGILRCALVERAQVQWASNPPYKLGTYSYRGRAEKENEFAKDASGIPNLRWRVLYQDGPYCVLPLNKRSR